MATRTVIALEDDLDGGPADLTLQFGLDGSSYEIDLSTMNVSAFRRELAPFLDHARAASRRPGLRPERTASSRRRSREVRAWARDQGIAVSDRGRLPASIAAQYEAATGT